MSVAPPTFQVRTRPAASPVSKPIFAELTDVPRRKFHLPPGDIAAARKFERGKSAGIFNGLEELHRTWGQLSEMGSHATINAIADRLTAERPDDRRGTLQLAYCGADERTWATSLFSLLLTSFTMERTFFKDYEPRLTLDHVLMDMRKRFEVFKESLRERLKTKYDITRASGTTTEEAH